MPVGIQVLLPGWDALIKAHAPVKLAFSERTPFDKQAALPPSGFYS